MDPSSISYIKQNIYIPPQPKKEEHKLPASHPSLIIADRGCDFNKCASCGCCKGDHCIKECASWLYKPNGEVKNVRKDANGSQEMLFYNLEVEQGRTL